MITTVRFLILFSILVSCSGMLSAQSDSLPDSKGRDFWFCFPPNFHNGESDRGIDDRAVQVRDSLFIFVAAEKPTNVTLEYADSSGRVYRRNFFISNPANMLSIGEQFYPFELMGYNRCGSVLDYEGGQNLRVANQYFHLWSDEDVTVYAMDQALTTSDAFLVLPTDALGNLYYVMSYPADPSSALTSSTPSQFAVVATQDSTVVRFTMPKPGLVFRYGNPPDSVVLQKGQVYLVQSKPGSYSSLIDLTGTLVKSNKPVAVFSGHQRAILPIESQQQLASRDCLIEQMTPVSTWGHTALLLPYPEPQDSVIYRGDRYRILAAYDSTDVYIDSVFYKNLDAGEFFEGDLHAPHTVFATRAVEVAQFKHTSSPSRSVQPVNFLGDPFMMIIPPSNQFLKSYRFVNVQASKTGLNGFPTETYEEQWLTVVLPTTSLPSLRVDGVAPTARFSPVPKSEYSYAALRMSDGVHTVSADTGVGIYVYGYGIANSYGYVGGMAYKRYDFNAPQVFGEAECYSLKGTSFDTALADTKIVSLKLMADSQFNTNVYIEPFIPPSDSVHFQGTLQDPLKDGYFMLEARDLEGYITRERFDIPGYTLRILGADSSLQLDRTVKEFSGPDRTYCKKYRYVNIGGFPHTVRNIISATQNPNISIAAPTPSVVKPGDTLSFTVCYRFHDFGTYEDSILVDLDCPLRTLIRYQISVGIDTVAPKIQAAARVCATDRVLLLSDAGDYQTGMQSVDIIDQHNCSISLSFDADTSKAILRVNDWRLDSWFSLKLVDSSGNTYSITDTVPGFTVMFSNVDSLTHAWRFQDAQFKLSQCDTIELYNYGLFSKTYSSLPLKQNTRFSFPQHQLPITLRSGERVRVAICFYPGAYPTTADSLWRDTLVLSEDCYTRELNFACAVVPNLFTGITRCDIPLTSNSLPEGQTQLHMMYPVPSHEELQLLVSVPVAQELRIQAVNEIGTVTELFRSSVAKGDYRIQVSTLTLQSGVYRIQLVDAYGGRSSLQHVVIH